MRKFFFIFQILMIFSTVAMAKNDVYPRGSHDVFIAKSEGVRTALLAQIAPLVERSIAAGNYPGAVILAGHKGQIIYRGVFGNRRIQPSTAPMKFDTVFDIASLTKVVATTPAIMQLVEKGKIDLDAPVAKYWPAFAKKDKNKITVRQLLTHTSGLPADVPEGNKETVLQEIENVKLQHPTGAQFFYSDVNFIALAHLVEIVSHQSFASYVQKNILNPMQLKHTGFNPELAKRSNIAPTQKIKGTLRWGVAQDPLAFAMKGISGNAGLFSNAEDLSIYVETLLNGGKIKNSTRYLLGPLAVEKMTTPQTPAAISETRALGWDMDSAYSNRGVLFPTTSFGHTGWTGTSIWIDPATQTWVIILTSRLHPKPAPHNPLVEDRRLISNIISGSLTDIIVYQKKNTSKGELNRAFG